MERKQLICGFCGWVWLSKIIPKVCPKCHNDWRKERSNGKPAE